MCWLVDFSFQVSFYECTKQICLKKLKVGWWEALCLLYLLDVIIQSNDFQRGAEVGAGWDGGTDRGGLAHVALIRDELEIWRLVVLVQDFDDEVSEGRKGVTVVLLSLEEGRRQETHTESLHRQDGPVKIYWEVNNGLGDKSNSPMINRALTPVSSVFLLDKQLIGATCRWCFVISKQVNIYSPQIHVKYVPDLQRESFII